MKQPATKTRPAAKRSANGRRTPAHLALIDTLPLGPLGCELDYDSAAALLDGLAVRPEGSLSAGEQDYFDTLKLLVEAYDREYDDIRKEDRDPLSMLRYLMRESGTTQADLGRLLDNRPLAPNGILGLPDEQ